VLLATAIHWFNPVVYLAARAIGSECEASCDAAVVKNAGPAARQRYCGIIINAAKPRLKSTTVLSTTFYEGKNGVKKRISSIMDTGKKRVGGLAVCAALLLCTFIVSAAVSAGAIDKTAGHDIFDLSVTLDTGLAVNRVNTTWYQSGKIVGAGGTVAEDSVIGNGEPMRSRVERADSFYADGTEVELAFELISNGTAYSVSERVPVTIQYGKTCDIVISGGGEALTAAVAGVSE
jgi:hypothetical protein